LQPDFSHTTAIGSVANGISYLADVPITFIVTAMSTNPFPLYEGLLWLRGATLAFLLCVCPSLPASGAQGVGLMTIDGAIGPATADYIVRGIAHSAEARHQLVILRMDTPGGLDTSMRSVIKAILASPVPVATFVAPSGARAASAGTYILYASHVAAMAPGTNLGAATPVAIGIGRQQPEEANKPERDRENGKSAAGSAMERKQVHDAAAYLRALAQMRGRNTDWAERAVRESVSLAADEALKQNVVEVVAADVPDLLTRLDGRSIVVLGQAHRLDTHGAAVSEFDPGWRTSALAAITNPSVALLLMTIGIYGLIFEFMNPGFVAPGVIGAICLLVGLYALQLLPVNYAGLGLIGLGLLFMGAEAFVPSFGILGLGGFVAFVMGALMLIDTDLPGYGIPPGVIAGLAAASALLVIGTARLAVKTRGRPVTSGAAALIGAVATVENVAGAAAGEGWVRIEGELWKAVSATPLHPSQTVQVVDRKGLVLHVVPTEKLQGT
jgi:membrane-bound serine protease (ClpP class)